VLLHVRAEAPSRGAGYQDARPVEPAAVRHALAGLEEQRGAEGGEDVAGDGEGGLAARLAPGF